MTSDAICEYDPGNVLIEGERASRRRGRLQDRSAALVSPFISVLEYKGDPQPQEYCEAGPKGNAPMPRHCRPGWDRTPWRLDEHTRRLRRRRLSGIGPGFFAQALPAHDREATEE